MRLETRVDTLERDFALLRAETRGWAEIATTANRKADMNAELLNLIYRELITVKTDVSELKTDVSELKTEVVTHGEILREHSATLTEHGEMLREILARLA